MTSIKSTARLAGIMYLTMAVMNVISFAGVFGHFVVPGDPAASVRQITEHEFAYRIAILNDFVAHILFLAVVVTLYDLFVDIERRLALLMVVFVVVPVAMQLGSLADRLAPLSLLRNPDYLSAFTQPQRDSVAQAFLGLHSNAGSLAMPFWGLWLFPFGCLAIKSRYFPRVLGILLLVAGVGYLGTGLTSLVFPDRLGAVSKVMMPLYFGEIPIVFWLAIMGARQPRDAARAAPLVA